MPKDITNQVYSNTCFINVCSGITLTKLVGVIVLGFSRSEVFVVCSCHLLKHQDVYITSIYIWSMNFLFLWPGLLLQDVFGTSPPRFLA